MFCWLVMMITVGILAASPQAEAAKVSWNFHTVLGKVDTMVVQGEQWAIDEIKKATNGEVEMTVFENLVLGATLKHAKTERKMSLEKVFSIFPVLEERLNQRARTLSGGEQQMLAIGRGMMTKPNLLMLDEPSLGLAPLLVQEVFRVLSQLKKQGLTILLVEQNVKHSLRLCDFAYVLENGRVALSGLGQELLEDEHTKKAYLGI